MPIASATDVIILSPTALYRVAWHALLDRQPDITVAGMAAVPAALTSVRVTCAPATVFPDVPTPHLDLIRQCRAVAPALKLLVESFELATLLPLLRAGVMECVAREDTVGNLAQAITAVGRRELILPSTIAAREHRLRVSRQGWMHGYCCRLNVKLKYFVSWPLDSRTNISRRVSSSACEPWRRICVAFLLRSTSIHARKPSCGRSDTPRNRQHRRFGLDHNRLFHPGG